MSRLIADPRNPCSWRPSDALQSHFDALGLQLRAWAGKRERVLTIGVMGETPGVGASTVAFHLANALAVSSFSGKVALVEANLSQPKLGESTSSGLIDVLTHQKKLMDCLIDSYCENLKVLPPGQVGGGKTVRLAWGQLKNLLVRELESFEFVVIDCPPVTDVNGSRAVASQLDGLIIISRDARSKSRGLEPLRMFLQDFPVDVLGTVVNRSVARSSTH